MKEEKTNIKDLIPQLEEAYEKFKHDIFIFENDKIILYIGKDREKYINQMISLELRKKDAIGWSLKSNDIKILDTSMSRQSGYVEKFIDQKKGYGIINYKKLLKYEELSFISKIILKIE